MKFMVTWTLKPPQQREATARFLQTGGGPPAGVKMLGRWHAPGSGFVLAETDDVKSVYEWIMQWSDLLEFGVTPVMEDAEAAEVMKKITK
jgi:Domain of unknown function (DUF3303)